MPLPSLTSVFMDASLIKGDELSHWLKEWRISVENGSEENLMTFLARELGLSDDVFAEKLASALGWEMVNLKDRDIPVGAMEKVSTKVAFQYKVFPFDLQDGVLHLAVCNPFDGEMLNAAQFSAGIPIKLFLAPASEIEKTLKKYYGVGAETLDELSSDDPVDLDLDIDKEITEDDQEASVIKFVNQIIWEAYKDRATDIHFEPAEDELRIRYRIDGILHQTPMPPHLKHFQDALISRIKVMSGMNISEKRLPQDGRINVRIKGQELDIRVSTVPTVYGESVSLRLLTRGNIFLTLDKLGFAREDEDALRELVVKPHGIILVTGPTGAGKSTSLYAFLSTINSVSKRIITIEEPVEYELKGINQIAVRSDIGLTFAKGLRHILRQDPNVVMVGECRDQETAEIAIRASLTGHLVFTTLHTNDSPSAFTRLIDMGIEPFLVASSVEAVLAQRLVRTICPACKEEQKVDRNYLRKIGFPEHEIESTTFYHGRGCEACRHNGYTGRQGIYELLVVDEDIRSLVLERAPATTIAQLALSKGLKNLRRDGWNKVKSGITTIEEVLRVTQTDQGRSDGESNFSDAENTVFLSKE